MTNWLKAMLALAATLAIGACSLETAINAMSSEADRQFAQEVVANMRSGNEAWLQSQSEEAFWQEHSGDVARFRSAFDGVDGPSRLVGYQVNTDRLGASDSTRHQRFDLVTGQNGPWVRSAIETIEQNGSPRRIVSWEVARATTMPPELTVMEASKTLVPWLWGFAILFLLVVMGAIWAIVRYNRKKREALRR